MEEKEERQWELGSRKIKHASWNITEVQMSSVVFCSCFFNFYLFIFGCVGSSLLRAGFL